MNARPAFPGPEDITRVELSNGIVLLTRPNFNSPSVQINGYLLAGGLFDPDEKLGLADFTASALMRGTTRRNFQQIYNSLESAGARLRFNSATHTVSFSGKALSEDLPMLLGLLDEALRQPAFPDDQIEKLRAQLLTGLAMRAQSTSEMASLTFDQVVYHGHPYSRPEEGNPETIQAITRQDLIDFQQKYYGPQGMVITIVGSISPEEAVTRVKKTLASWQNPQQPKPPVLPDWKPLESTITQKATLPEKSQADILLGTAGPARRHPDFLAAAIGNNILGQFGMMGRIGDAVREKAGLAYYATSNVSGGIGPGPWAVRAGVAPENVERAIALILKEIKRFIEQPVLAEELADSQANFIGSLPLSLESNAGVSAALLNLERHQLGLDYYQRYADLIRAVTAEDILRVAQEFLDPDKLGIAIAGP